MIQIQWGEQNLLKDLGFSLVTPGLPAFHGQQRECTDLCARALWDLAAHYFFGRGQNGRDVRHDILERSVMHSWVSLTIEESTFRGCSTVPCWAKGRMDFKPWWGHQPACRGGYLSCSEAARLRLRICQGSDGTLVQWFSRCDGPIRHLLLGGWKHQFPGMTWERTAFWKAAEQGLSTRSYRNLEFIGFPWPVWLCAGVPTLLQVCFLWTSTIQFRGADCH